MATTLQAVRGMRDILPAEGRYFTHLETIAREILTGYGYEEIRLPLVESTELFKRTIGEVTDIVEKEMYTFEDRNGDSLSLRPEGTAGCVRAGIEHGRLHNQVQRLWYGGAMFRHERPQKGRYRQFHQIGVATFGMARPAIEAEQMIMPARLRRRLGIEGLVLQINSLGTPAVRAAYREQLVVYLGAHQDALDEDSRRRLQSNQLRILDSKNPAMAELIAGAQGTGCAGGRYDCLVAQLGVRPTPAAGFARGIERLVSLMQEGGAMLPDTAPHLYFVIAGSEAERVGPVWAEQMRNACPGLRLVANAGGGGFKAQMKRADKSGAAFALIVGDNEVAGQSVGVKSLRADAPQRTWPWRKLLEVLSGCAAADIVRVLSAG